MADKKITALTELASTAKAAADLLHIIDFSASPVNKKITLANLFTSIPVNTDLLCPSGGTITFEVKPASGISGFKVNVPNPTPSSSAVTEAVVNENGNAFVDFRVETSLNDHALHVDSSLDSGAGNCNTITVNGGAIASTKLVDFNINSKTGILFHTDANDHAVGIGTTTPSASFMLDVIADATSGGSINSAGWLAMSTNDTRTGAGAVGVTTPVTFLSNSSGASALTIGNGTNGQIKILVCTVMGGGSMAFTSQSNIQLGGGGTTLTFDSVGETAILMYVNSKWQLLAGTAAVS